MGILDYLGDFLGTSNNSAVDKGIRSLDDIKAYADSTAAKNNALYRQYYDQMQGMYGDNAAKYNDAVSRLADAIDSRGDFEYSGNVDDYLDPAREQRVSAAMSAINNSAAAGGNRFSSNYIDKVAAKQQALASEEWRNAYDRMMQDRSQQLQEWQTGQQKINNLGTLAGVYGGDRNQLSDAIGNYYSNVANQNNANLEVMSDIVQNKANLNASRTNGMGDIIGGAAKIVGSLFA
ncbi:MAG: hypothetical protein J6W22_05960 [Fibrobacter sp.]|nr:hypothetical protein [Fibrobacter sp.]